MSYLQDRYVKLLRSKLNSNYHILYYEYEVNDELYSLDNILVEII